MEKGPTETQLEICKLIKNAKNTEDFLVIQAISSNLFSSKTEEDVDAMLRVKDLFYITAVENLFNNTNFVESLGKVLDQYKSFQKNFDPKSGVNFFEAFNDVEIKNKKFIFAGLVASLMLTSSVVDRLGSSDISYIADKIYGLISRLKNNFKYKHSQSEIYGAISSVFNRKFYSTIPEKINNPGHLFRAQKISSYMIRLALRLFFRNSRLNNIFKSVERDKMRGKFGSYSINRIVEIVKKDKDSEKKSIEVLMGIMGDKEKVLSFTSPFKKDKNEENAFNLIDITLREFQYIENFEIDLSNTIKKASSISEELKNYGKDKFRAFSGNVELEDYEWSNKIYINCSKLLGALGSLINAQDKDWQMNASVNEFVDWTSSIHKVLNKYDIEDDWDKISKYLDQETNKVEWKSSFFTPTQISQADLSYGEVSKKVFLGIVKTILGMINSDGGVIIIGLVEKPDEIVDSNVKSLLLEKNKKFFLDISDELSKNKMDLDAVKRKIQDTLKVETLTSVDNFNNLWNIQQLNIKSGDGLREICVYKIEITKSDKPIFSIKSEKVLNEGNKIDLGKNENIWISLLKRADARTIYVDPRKYISS